MFGDSVNNLDPVSFKNTLRPIQFYEKWSGEANFFLIQGENKTLRGENCLVTFESQDEWHYSLVVDVSQNTSNTDDNKYAFPISGKMNLRKDICEETQSLLFELDLSVTNKVQFEFEKSKDEFNLSHKFLYIITRLMYQTDNRNSYEQANEAEFQSYCRFKKEKKPEISMQIQEMMGKLAQDTSVNFCAVGELSMYNP